MTLNIASFASHLYVKYEHKILKIALSYLRVRYIYKKKLLMKKKKYNQSYKKIIEMKLKSNHLCYLNYHYWSSYNGEKRKWFQKKNHITFLVIMSLS